MNLSLPRALLAMAIANSVMVAACSSSVSPVATATPPKAATPSTTPMLAKLPTAAPSNAERPVSTAADVAAVSLSDLVSKSRTINEYSFDLSLEMSGQSIALTVYVKGRKMRQEITAGAMNTVTIMDLAAQTAYTVLPEQNFATKMDLAQLPGRASSLPNEEADLLPPDTSFVRTDIVDGKPAALFLSQSANRKTWLWTEHGLPLRMEENGRSSEFVNYRIGPQPDSLFELPPGVKVQDLRIRPGVTTSTARH